jgi:hypothetical protein
MDVRARTMYHQIHPAKLATDISTGFIALALLWQRHLMFALVVMVGPPIVASGLLIRWGHLDDLARTRAGARMYRMTGRAIAIRVTGMLVMSMAAWQREPALLVLGAVLIVAAWMWVLR